MTTRATNSRTASKPNRVAYRVPDAQAGQRRQQVKGGTHRIASRIFHERGECDTLPRKRFALYATYVSRCVAAMPRPSSVFQRALASSSTLSRSTIFCADSSEQRGSPRPALATGGHQKPGQGQGIANGQGNESAHNFSPFMRIEFLSSDHTIVAFDVSIHSRKYLHMGMYSKPFSSSSGSTEVKVIKGLSKSTRALPSSPWRFFRM